MAPGNTRRHKRESGGLGYIDRLLTGEDDHPVSVTVDLVEKGSNTYIQHNIQNVADFTPIDFFMPLVLLLIIFGIQMVDFLGIGLKIILILQVALVRDLFSRVKRRPSGRATVGFVPPFTSADWGKALLIYLAALPLDIGALWLNRKIYIWLFPRSMLALREKMSEMAGAEEYQPLVEINGAVVLIILLVFFSAVVFAPVYEELWFRGIGLAGFLKTGSRLRAVIWTSLIFAVLHGPTRILDCTVSGVAFALIRFRTGSLYCSMAVHALHNFAATVIWVYYTFTLA